MKKINFKKLPVSVDVKGKNVQDVDIAEVLANAIYQTQSDILMFKLSQKIYDAEDKIELNDKEIDAIKNWVKGSKLFLPIKMAIAKQLEFELDE